MERKTVDALRVMICGELDEVAKQGTLTHESLDIVKDLLESLKNLKKIEKLEDEKEERMMGYSQRSMGRYYIDGTYGNGNSYAGNQYSMNSYARGGNSNAQGNSNYGFYPMYENSMYSGRGYSRHGEKHEIIEKLQELMNETNDEKVRNSISEAINKMNM